MVLVLAELTVALAKGKLLGETAALFTRAGLPCPGDADSRRLLFTYPEAGLRFLVARPSDVPVYVEYGAADLGVVGKDVLVETGADVPELLDLGYGYCRLVVAVPAADYEARRSPDGSPPELAAWNNCRVATKFPQVAARFFRQRGLNMEVIKLHGNLELAPQTGLAAAIVDIVSTGRTLQENDLVPVIEVFSATARLVANRVSYQVRHRELWSLVERLRQATRVGKGEEGGRAEAL